MWRVCLILMASSSALAQAFPTEFPAGTTALESQALKQRLVGKAFKVKPAEGAPFRIAYREGYVDLNIYAPGGTLNDSGTWKVEGSSVCIEWQRFKSGCSEYRLLGETLYTRRVTNNEVVPVQPD